jgi:hypothetical protein
MFDNSKFNKFKTSTSTTLTEKNENKETVYQTPKFSNLSEEINCKNQFNNYQSHATGVSQTNNFLPRKLTIGNYQAFKNNLTKSCNFENFIRKQEERRISYENKNK